jgi:sugar phosphate permease
MRTLQNYTLELAPSDNYPRYLSTLGLCVAAPMMASPLVGLAIDNWGFEEVFFAISGFLLIGWLQTLLLAEPRRRARAADLTGRLNVES